MPIHDILQKNNLSVTFKKAFKIKKVTSDKKSLLATKETVSILKNISRFITGNRGLSKSLQLYLYSWEDHFQLNRLFIIEDSIGIRFQADNSMELVFPSQELAKSFYETTRKLNQVV